MGIMNTSGWGTSTFRIEGYYLNSSNVWVRVPGNDKTFDLSLDPWEFTAEIQGQFYTGLGWEEGGTSATLEVTGEFVSSMVMYGEQSWQATVFGEFVAVVPFKNFVRWSKIGEANFDLDNVNDAGYMQLPWKGWAYGCLALDKNIIVYGEGGISSLYPAGLRDVAPTYGLKPLSKIGLLGKYCYCGSLKNHFAINRKGDLIQVSEQDVQVLGYSEFLLSMHYQGKSIVMTYDEDKQRVYICNGIQGYVYTPQGLTKGPSNLSGLISDKYESQVTSPSSLSIPSFELATEVMDFGTRDVKALYQLSVSTHTPKALQFAVSYRDQINEEFVTSAWCDFDSRGLGWPMISAVEFKIHLKAASDFEGEIDDLVAHYRLFDRTLVQEGTK